MAALARERDTAQQLADTDHLTGAMSRRHFEQCLERDAAIARRDGRPLSLLIVDVDHFKRINDTLGHATGDDVLRALVGAFQERLRGTDCIGRLGGEEFAVSLPATDMVGASALADQLRRAIEANGFLRDDGTRVPVTVSVGVSTLDGSGVATLRQRADDALYRAKHEGRNRVVAGNAAG